MCLAFPGKIEKINGQLATVNFDGIKKEVNVSLVDAKAGEYVIVHAGFAVEKMNRAEAEKINSYKKK